MHLHVAVLRTCRNPMAKSRAKIRSFQITFTLGHGSTCNVGAHYVRRGRRDTTPELVHIDDGRRGQHVPGADIPAAVPHGRHRSRRRRRQRVRLVQLAVGNELRHAVAGRYRIRYRHVRQRLRNLWRVPERGSHLRRRRHQQHRPQLHCIGSSALNGSLRPHRQPQQRRAIRHRCRPHRPYDRYTSRGSSN